MRRAGLIGFAAVPLALLLQPVLAGEADERFDVMEYRVLGNAVLPPIEVERAVYTHLGPDKTVADIELARQALESAYRTAGFATAYVDIPEQDVERGIVRLRVTEGKLDRVRVTGARYVSGRRILAAVPAASAGETPNLPVLQEELSALNRQTADLRVTPVLKAGRSPGLVDLELRVQDELPVQASVELNDRYTPDTSELRLNANLGYNNLFQRRHAFGLQYQTSPQSPDEVQVFAASYTIPMGSGGRLLALSAIRSDTDVAALGTLGVLGRGTILGARMLWPLSIGQWTGSVSFGADYRNVKELIFPEPDPGTVDEETDDAISRPIEYMGWSLQHGLQRRGEGFMLDVSLGATYGIRGLFNEPAEFQLKRYRAGPNFFYLRGGFNLEWLLWRGMTLVGKMSGQYSGVALISNEQFSIGGLDTVRGYTEADQFGDYGYAGGLELRSPGLRPLAPIDLQLLAFWDFGVVGLQDPLPGQDRSADLVSVGLGARLRAFGAVEGRLDWARALRPSNRVDEGDSRLHFSLKYSF
jgi:hemolysin activation/secretion protein